MLERHCAVRILNSTHVVTQGITNIASQWMIFFIRTMEQTQTRVSSDFHRSRRRILNNQIAVMIVHDMYIMIIVLSYCDDCFTQGRALNSSPNVADCD